MEIDKKILKEISDYCRLNNLDENTFINKLLKSAFAKEKYGERPSIIDIHSIVEDYKIDTTIIEDEKVSKERALNDEKPTDVEVIKQKRRKKIESL